MAYYESEPQQFGGNDQSTEKSIKSCYAVVYELKDRKWVVAGEGGWSEVHLCEDSLDNSHRILAWTVKSQQVLMNCNVTSECTYKEKSKNFHSFSDENGNRYGLGFHKSESGLKQAAQFLKAVMSVITDYKAQLNAQPPPPPQSHIQSQPSQSQSSTMPPPNPYQPSVSDTYAQGKNQPPPMFSQQSQQSQQQSQDNGHSSNNANANANGYSNDINEANKKQLSPSPEYGSNKQLLKAQPTYHLDSAAHNSIPESKPGGLLKILPPKDTKHTSGDNKITNPSIVDHKVRVTHDVETGLYSGLPPEWLDHLNKQFGVNPKHLPGLKMDGYASKIPKVLVTLRQALEDSDGYSRVGIFRLAPNKIDNNKVKAKIDKGQLNDEEKIDVNVYANLIKVWFRDLPDPLLNCVNPDLIEHVSNMDDARNVIGAMKEPNKSIFLWLCDMCVSIGQHKQVNKMGPQNMAIVVGPNLFNTDKFENPMKAMTYSGKVVEFFKHCILWREQQLQQ